MLRGKRIADLECKDVSECNRERERVGGSIRLPELEVGTKVTARELPELSLHGRSVLHTHSVGQSIC